MRTVDALSELRPSVCSKTRLNDKRQRYAVMVPVAWSTLVSRSDSLSRRLGFVALPGSIDIHVPPRLITKSHTRIRTFDSLSGHHVFRKTAGGNCRQDRGITIGHGGAAVDPPTVVRSVDVEPLLPAGRRRRSGSDRTGAETAQCRCGSAGQFSFGCASQPAASKTDCRSDQHGRNRCTCQQECRRRHREEDRGVATGAFAPGERPAKAALALFGTEQLP